MTTHLTTEECSEPRCVIVSALSKIARTVIESDMSNLEAEQSSADVRDCVADAFVALKLIEAELVKSASEVDRLTRECAEAMRIADMWRGFAETVTDVADRLKTGRDEARAEAQSLQTALEKALEMAGDNEVRRRWLEYSSAALGEVAR